MGKDFTSRAAYPAVRLRRLRQTPWIRRLASGFEMSPNDLIWPLFVQEGHGQSTPVPSMPGVERLSLDRLVEAARLAADVGLPSVAIFPVVTAEKKSPEGEEACNPDNLVCRAIRAIKAEVPDIGVIADVALDPYTSHGQDGLLAKDGSVVNDATVAVLVDQARILADAGCDIVAPSDMMDGRVGAIRRHLDQCGHENTLILAYAAKYASSYYDPFRVAVGSLASLGEKTKSDYQMDPARRVEEAVREVTLDIEEGADMVMVKPGMPYLDVLTRVVDAVDVPVLVYQASGEYAALKAAAEAGWLNFRAAQMEAMIAFKRAGATAIFSYSACDVAQWLISQER